MYSTVITTICLLFRFFMSSELDIDKRIYRGELAKIEDYPHAIAVEVLFGVKLWGLPIGSWGFICGGSIIHHRWVISAAHCVDRILMGAVRIVYGTYYVSLIWEGGDYIANVEKIEFKSPNRTDLVLLKLESKITFSTQVNAIKLNTRRSGQEPKEMNGSIAGWGKSEEGYLGTRSFFLKSLKVKIHHSASISFIRATADNGGGGCPGDFGGGLVIELNNEKLLLAVLIGAVKAFSCENNIYIRVDWAENWINETISLK